MKTNGLLMVFAGLVLACLPAAAQEQEQAATDLRPQWTAGQTARYSFWGRTEKTETAQAFGQVKTETTVYLTEGEIVWVVDAINDDGTAACTMKLDKIKFKLTAGENEPLVIDSENPSGDRPAFDGLLSAMVGSPLKVVINADGTVASLEGIEALAQAAGQEARDADMVPDELDFKETASDLATLLSAPASATVGQTWNAKNTWNQDNVIPGTDALADWDTTYTFDSLGLIEGVPIATIKSESDIDIKLDLSKLPDNEATIDVQIGQAKGKGEVLFDLSRHEAVARNDSMSYTANVTITPPTDKVPPIKIKIVEKSQSQLLRLAEE